MVITRARTMVGAAVPWASEFERETYSPTLTRILNHADALGININTNSPLKAAN